MTCERCNEREAMVAFLGNPRILQTCGTCGWLERAGGNTDPVAPIDGYRASAWMEGGSP